MARSKEPAGETTGAATDTAATSAALPDELFTVRPEEFVATRTRLAAERKRAGDRAGAERIAALRRPSPSVWALNRLAREEPDVMAALALAQAALRRAQEEALAGRTADLLGLGRKERALVAGAVERAATTAAAAGEPVSEAMRKRLEATLRAALTAGGEATEALRAGRLLQDEAPDAGFGFDEALVASLAAAPSHAATQHGRQRRPVSAHDAAAAKDAPSDREPAAHGGRHEEERRARQERERREAEQRAREERQRRAKEAREVAESARAEAESAREAAETAAARVEELTAALGLARRAAEETKRAATAAEKAAVAAERTARLLASDD